MKKILLILLLFSSVAYGQNKATLTPTTGAWSLIGNSVAAGNVLGTTNNASLRFITNNTAVAVVDSNGRLGIGTPAPGELLSLGLPGTLKGVLSLSGNTSGKIIMQPAAAAGTWTWTLPTDDGEANYFLQTNGSGVTSWAAGNSGTVTSVSFTGGLISVATATTTPALTIAGTSGGIPYFSSASTWASSAALAANAIVIGGGAGVAPSTTTTGTGILTWIGTPSSANLLAALTTKTGTGNAVFSASPTFTGTILGASASLSGTLALSSGTGYINGGHLILGSSNPQDYPYRKTNAGSNVTQTDISIYAEIPDAGIITFFADFTNQNGLILAAGNGTRQISRAAINIANLTNTAGSEAGDLIFQTQSGGTAMSTKLTIPGAGGLLPGTNDVGALGSATLSWSDMYLASGALINFANGNAVITHSSGILTVSTGDLRVTTAGTNATSVVTNAGTQTLTNKRITQRVGTTTSSATPTINTDNVDAYSITALTDNITSFTSNLSGTPVDFQRLTIRILDDGAGPYTIAWGASFEAAGVALPTTTVTSKLLTVGFIWNSSTSKWGCVASAQTE